MISSFKFNFDATSRGSNKLLTYKKIERKYFMQEIFPNKKNSDETITEIYSLIVVYLKFCSHCQKFS